MKKRKSGRRPVWSREEAAAADALRYIESSAVVAALLERDVAALEAMRALGRRITSALTFAETGRALSRARAAGRLTAAEERAAVTTLAQLEQRVHVVDVSADVLARARRPFPVDPIRTLDAIHLATVELLGDSPPLVTIVTRDERIRANALALGYQVE